MTLLSYGRALLKQGASLTAIAHAAKTPRILTETTERYTRELARAGWRGNTRFIPKLAELDLPEKLNRALERAGFSHVQELCLCTAMGLKSVRGVGIESVRVISDALARFGLTLRSEATVYTDQVLVLYPNTKSAPISVLHLEHPRDLCAMINLHRQARIYQVGDLIKRTEGELRQITAYTGTSRAGLYGSVTVTNIRQILEGLDLSFRQE